MNEGDYFSLFFQIVQIVTPIIVGLVGIGIRIVINLIRSLREDLKEYVRRETCRAHREAIAREISDIRNLIKFGRRQGDGALTELINAFNERMHRVEQEEQAEQKNNTPPCSNEKDCNNPKPCEE